MGAGRRLASARGEASQAGQDERAAARKRGAPQRLDRYISIARATARHRTPRPAQTYGAPRTSGESRARDRKRRAAVARVGRGASVARGANTPPLYQFRRGRQAGRVAEIALHRPKHRTASAWVLGSCHIPLLYRPTRCSGMEGLQGFWLTSSRLCLAPVRLLVG